MKRLITLCLLGGCFLSAPAQNYVSQAWVGPTKAMGPTKIQSCMRITPIRTFAV